MQMQLKENLLDNMRYKTKKIKKYAEGGSGYGVDYSYRDNTLNSNIANETQYNQQKNNYYTDLANQNYLLPGGPTSHKFSNIRTMC